MMLSSFSSIQAALHRAQLLRWADEIPDPGHVVSCVCGGKVWVPSYARFEGGGFTPGETLDRQARAWHARCGQ